MGIKYPSEAQKPYDTSLENNFSMYDKLPYQRNAELCNASTIRLNSGNLLKYYRCYGDTEAKEISTQDDVFSSIISEHIEKHEKYLHDLHTHFPNLYGPLEDNLLEDNSEEPSAADTQQDEDLS